MTARQITQLRKRLGLTQQQFADTLGLGHRATICNLEAGRREPRGALLQLLRRLDAEKKSA